MLTRKEVSKRLKAKAKAKDRGGKSLHIYIPGSMYTEKTDGGERISFTTLTFVTRNSHNVLLLRERGHVIDGKCYGCKSCVYIGRE